MKLDEWDALFIKVQKEVHNLYKKNRVDYLKLNYDPLSSFLRAKNIGVEPYIAAMVRLGDKFTLLENFVRKGNYETHDESIRETLLDISAYSILTILLLDYGEKK